MLEVQIAFALLGIGLAGLCPFVVMQLRQLEQASNRRLKASTYIYQQRRNGIQHECSRTQTRSITWFPGTTLGREN